ncbi:MAG: type IV secretion system DNA-binding domain-containing protein [Candidatus Doudnabacteria bacterium]|nr:type IV secretion system DNA-binding domain-containing protein [Candidatus Doudnabacteria bacterium]
MADNDVTIFAKTNFRNKEVPFGIRREDRRRHMYVMGKSGMGKTTLIENMVIQDIINGHGVAFVDPHGDSVEKILDYIPSNRVNDVIYFNPADMDFPIAFNPLESVDEKYKHLVASGLMGVFTKIWAGVWSARMEYILANTILALLDSPGNTMLGIARMYVDKNYRKRIVDNIKDPVVKSFWRDEFANYQDKFRSEAVAPIQNKVGQFLSSAIIRNIVGQTRSSIDLRDIMDNKKILLVNLSKGRIGEDASALLGAMIITKLQLAAMSRVDIPEEERADFYLYVDEFQNFATESFANILSEARKFRLNLIVAHQYIGQLVHDRNTIVRDAIFGNVGTMIIFRVGADDAEFLEKEFEPTYTMNDLVNLAQYSIYLKLLINGVTSNPFSAKTLPPISTKTGNGDKVISVSRERYGTERSVVEEKINKWMGAEFHTEAAKIESESAEAEDMQEHLRFEHRVTTGPAAQIRANAPLAPRTTSRPVVERRPEVRREEPRSATNEVVKTYDPKEHRENHDKRVDLERRNKHLPNNPARRVSDKPQTANKPKPPVSRKENPIWETVNQLSTEKLKDKVEATTQALESLSREIETRLHDKPAPKVISNSEPIPSAPEEVELATEQLPKEIPAQIKRLHKEDSPVQSGTLKPGETVKF